MNCQDVAKLRTPLDAVCQTTDIGCVPIVDGKPTCSPQPDELPFAFDPKTTTLWIFSCKTREWINFTKFTMCQLDALNLDNITNICDILNIGVNYAGSGECKQGTITLAELVERIKECLELETKIITIGEGDGNKIKISIDGLPNLPPVYVQGENIWSEGGSGTETDPLIVATYDPICKWPTKTQKQVDDARVKHLGACLDGEMSRVPFPPKVCELPEISQEQVDASNDKKVIACVDGNGVKAPFPLEPCKYPQMTAEQVKNASDKDLIVCVDGQNGKVPVPDSLFDTSLCEYPLITLDEAKGLGTNLTIGACAAGREVRIPVYGSGFFDRDYICVPLTDGQPSGAPFSGTGPLRVDCNGTLWVWLCDQSKWQRVTDGIGGIPGLNPANVPDICNNLRLKGWYSNNADPCVQEVQMTLQQLAVNAVNCSLNDPSVVNNITTAVINEIKARSTCQPTFTSSIEIAWPLTDNREFRLNKINLASSIDGESNTFNRNYAIYNLRKRRWEVGSGAEYLIPESDWQNNYRVTLTFTNNTQCRKFYTIKNMVQLVQNAKVFDTEFSVSVVARAMEDLPNLSYAEFSKEIDGWAPIRTCAGCNWNSKVCTSFGVWNGPRDCHAREFGISPVEMRVPVDPGQTRTFYMHGFLIISSPAASIANQGDIVKGWGVYAQINEYKNIYID